MLLCKKTKAADLNGLPAKKGMTIEKAVEAAIIAVKEFNATPEVAAQKMDAPLELVLEGLKKKENS